VCMPREIDNTFASFLDIVLECRVVSDQAAYARPSADQSLHHSRGDRDHRGDLVQGLADLPLRNLNVEIIL
jgi:hypothetical protein